MNGPADAEFYDDMMFYKVGYLGYVYYWNLTEWVRSSKFQEELSKFRKVVDGVVQPKREGKPCSRNKR